MNNKSHAVGIVNALRFKSLEAAINEAMRLINFNLDREIKQVAIKPNLCYYWSSTTGETTDPKFVEALVNIIRTNKKSSEISIVESDATVMRTKHAFKILGYEDLASRKGLRLVNLCEDELLPIPEHLNTSVLRELQIKIPKTLVDADLFVSVPTLKVHPLPGLSCALKNQFGCVPIRRKESLHKRLTDVVASINRVLAPHLVVVDGITCRGKYPKKLNLIMTSCDPVAADFIAAKIAGLNPKRIRHLVKSEELGVGSTDVILRGDDWTYFADRFPRKGFLSNISRRGLLAMYGWYLRFFTLEGRLFKMRPSATGA
ncbi:MAG: DUF362 domain-containing protein [Candidatus Bathyarchaeota archaeon]|nr:MAG: DUF362 domain-containing protein [Candidatus Bathyarchaeota archaeon]